MLWRNFTSNMIKYYSKFDALIVVRFLQAERLSERFFTGY
jgi:hypothetical protein